MINCRQSTEWVIKKEHGKLSVRENLQLLSHLAICRFCRLFAYQSSFINKAFDKSKGTDVLPFTAAEKEKLLRSVQNKIKE
jgi:hypothetical protein